MRTNAKQTRERHGADTGAGGTDHAATSRPTEAAAVLPAQRMPSSSSRIAPNQSAHRPFIVTCPACGGDGRLQRDGSQAFLSCRLCWEHGVVARIVAERYLTRRGLTCEY
jgi:hypothetical protein